MAKQAFIATIQILIQDPKIRSEAQACDCISEIMSRECGPGMGIVDWQYLEVGGQYLSPNEKIVPDDYQEGDAF